MPYGSVPVRPSTNGADPDIATDTIGGVEFQRAKFTWGPEGTANEIQDTAPGRLPVGGTVLDGLSTRLDTAIARLDTTIVRLDQALTRLDHIKARTGVSISHFAWEAALNGQGALVAAQTGLCVTGFCVRETTGTATAMVYIRNGAVIGATKILEIALAENESVRESFDSPIPSGSGIFVNCTGTTTVIVYYKLETA